MRRPIYLPCSRLVWGQVSCFQFVSLVPAFRRAVDQHVVDPKLDMMVNSGSARAVYSDVR